MDREPRLLMIARILLGLPFLASGLLKLDDPGRFLVDMQAFDFLPYWLTYITALALPWLEILCAVCMFSRKLLLGALTLLSGLTAFFIGFIAFATYLGYNADCGCFGKWLVFPSVTAHIAFNACLLLGLLTLIALTQSPTREAVEAE
jgi:uncharacterized membrane protein YphA (DoxX/SURF4 family)